MAATLERTETPRRPLRCAIYVRVSTDDGEQDPMQQLAPCRAEAARRGWEVVWEGDDRESGTVEVWNRRRGAELWKLVKNRAVDVVITYDASRLSRESAPAVMALIDRLHHHGVGYVSATENILDTSADNDFRDVLLAFVAWANHYYIKQLRRATRRGLAAARAAGRPIGRHKNGCGIIYLCPTGVHGPDGRPLRPGAGAKRVAWGTPKDDDHRAQWRDPTPNPRTPGGNP